MSAFYTKILKKLWKVNLKYSRCLSFSFVSLNKQTPDMKYLNVAEKNDAAKNIAAILSRGSSSRREGLSPYNKIYEFNSQIFGQQIKMVMTSVSGHLLNYEFASSFKSWQGCNPVALFDAQVIKACPHDYQKIKRTLEREIVSCQGLVIWTDCDREGENIGFEIIKVCTDVKPDIVIYRAKFSEITGTSIFRAMNTLGQPNKNVSDAVDVRQELDLRTGAAFTRLQTLRLQKAFPQKLADKLISYGSCQFPTLGFVVERYQAIEDFIPEPFWKIKMSHTVKDLTTEFNWKRDRLFEKNSCEAILDICLENPQATIESVEQKEKSKWRPVPLDTVEMEKNVSRKLRINAKETMKIAEKLYTQGVISYPRTETNIFPKELSLAPLVEQQTGDPRWGPFANRIINEGGPNPRQGKKSDQAHPPIHPIKYVGNLTGNEQKVYEYIVRHFLACLHKDAKGFETTVNADVAGEKFVAKGLIILERNYLDVYTYERWNAKEINNYARGDVFAANLGMVEGTTSPPKLLTEADLIALMEKHGIGTDATHAEHIEKIKSRQYVGLHDNMYFVPGTLGMGLVEGYNNIGLEVSLAKPVLRAEFENDLKLICDGLKNAEDVRREQIAKYREVFSIVTERMRLIDDSLSNRLGDAPVALPEGALQMNIEVPKTVLKCPKCGADMTLREKKDKSGKFLSCSGFPNCKNSVFFPHIAECVEVLDDYCENCVPEEVRLLRIKFRKNPFPGDPNPNTLCIGGCDRNVLETLNISYSAVKATIQRQVPQQRQPQTAVNYDAPRQRTYSNNSTLPLTSNQSNINRSINTTLRPQSNPESAQNTNTRLQPPRPQARPSFDDSRRNATLNTSTNNDQGDIVCACNVEAIQLTVKKEGPNKGRKFYKCKNSTCQFFLWATDDSDVQNITLTRNNQNDSIQCNCHLEASLKTVMKEGPNTGRQFYCCPKGMGESCRFFQWADQDGESNTSTGWRQDGNSRGGRGRGGTTRGRGSSRGGASTSAGSSNGAPRAKRKCGSCGQEGHTRTRCPNNN